MFLTPTPRLFGKTYRRFALYVFHGGECPGPWCGSRCAHFEPTGPQIDLVMKYQISLCPLSADRPKNMIWSWNRRSRCAHCQPTGPQTEFGYEIVDFVVSIVSRQAPQNDLVMESSISLCPLFARGALCALGGTLGSLGHSWALGGTLGALDWIRVAEHRLSSAEALQGRAL